MARHFLTAEKNVQIIRGHIGKYFGDEPADYWLRLAPTSFQEPVHFNDQRVNKPSLTITNKFKNPKSLVMASKSMRTFRGFLPENPGLFYIR
jgi:hypothetical protein